ncbi:TPA: pathogenicity island 2 effector protein SseG [Morganella morganii]|nr:pathogenicity island 2 effector protein SseG [Morganella morganii]
MIDTDIGRTGHEVVVSAEMQKIIKEIVAGLPVPVLPAPRDDAAHKERKDTCRQGQKRMLARLTERAAGMIPAELFSRQSVVLGGQIFCCSAAIALAVSGGGAVPLLLFAGVGLSIAVADIACLIYHRKHTLPMGHDSIANAVYLIAHRFYDVNKSKNIGEIVSLGSRALLTAAVMGRSFMMTSAGLSHPYFRLVHSAAWGTLKFLRYGAAGCPVTGQQAGAPFFRLLKCLFPPADNPAESVVTFRPSPDR